MATQQLVIVPTQRKQELIELVNAWRALHQDCFDIENSKQFEMHMGIFKSLKQRTAETLGEEQ